MAAKKKTETTPPRNNGGGPPKGFRSRTAAQGAPWVEKAEGNIVQGVLQGRFARATAGDDGQTQYYYQLLLSQPASVVLKGGEVETAEPGTLVNLDEIAAFKPLKQAMEENEPNVWIQFVERRNISSRPGKKYWHAEVATASEEIPF